MNIRIVGIIIGAIISLFAVYNDLFIVYLIGVIIVGFFLTRQDHVEEKEK